MQCLQDVYPDAPETWADCQRDNSASSPTIVFRQCENCTMGKGCAYNRIVDSWLYRQCWV